PSASVHDGGRMSDAELTIDGSLFQASKAGRTVRPRHVLKGTRFYIVDARVAAARRRWRPRPRSSPPSVVVALGGGLHVRRVAARLVTAIAEASPDADILVAAGFTAGPRPRLCRGRWLTANGLIAALRRSHAAVVAGGVTLYGACALGVPAVGFAVVREQ